MYQRYLYNSHVLAIPVTLVDEVYYVSVSCLLSLVCKFILLDYLFSFFFDDFLLPHVQRYPTGSCNVVCLKSESNVSYVLVNILSIFSQRLHLC